MLEPAQKYNSRINLKLIPDIISGWKIIVMLFSVVILFGFIIWWLNQNQGLYGFWNGFNLDKRVPASFCEQVHLNNPVRQPLNTFSNIVYLVTGKEALVAMILFFLFLAAGFVTFITQKYKPGSQYLLYSVISVMVAAIWFEFDKYKIICNPKSFFQPHSLWNVFIGISAFWFYLYMRSVPFKY